MHTSYSETRDRTKNYYFICFFINFINVAERFEHHYPAPLLLLSAPRSPYFIYLRRCILFFYILSICHFLWLTFFCFCFCFYFIFVFVFVFICEKNKQMHKCTNNGNHSPIEKNTFKTCFTVSQQFVYATAIIFGAP